MYYFILHLTNTNYYKGVKFSKLTVCKRNLNMSSNNVARSAVELAKREAARTAVDQYISVS